MGEIESVIQDLYANNESKLRQMCYKEIAKFGGISQMEYDNFYSRVGLEISLVITKNKFNPNAGKTFLEYISGVIKRSIWKEMTDKNRFKRQLIIEREEQDKNGDIRKIREYVPNLSIDTPIDEEDGLTIGDTLASSSDIESEIECFDENNRDNWHPQLKEYINDLSPLQREIAYMIADNYTQDEICDELHISESHYNNSVKRMFAAEKIAPLRSLVERR